MIEPLMRKTFGQMLDDITDQYPENEALVHPQSKTRYTYAQFRGRVNNVAKGLLAIGVKNGDKVAVWSTNYPQWMLLQFATARIGAILVTVNTNYKTYELKYLLQQSDAMTLVLSKGIGDSDYPDMVRKLCPTLDYSAPGELVSEDFPFLKNVIYMEDEHLDGMYAFNQLYEYASYVSDHELKEYEKDIDIHDVVNMQYTSGTTGFPKGVMLTHYNVVNNGRWIGNNMELTHKDRLCIPVPLFHCFGCVLGVMAAVTHGTTIVLVDHFSPIPVMEAVQEEKCTALHGVPTMYIALLTNEHFKEYDFSSLRTGIMAGSPCPVEIMKQVIKKMNMHQITIAYGQTEASPVCTQTTVNDTFEHRVDSVGKAMPYIECKITDPETGKDLPPGHIGELCARGYNIMKGYYKMPEETAKAIDSDGWLHTGDLASMSEEGYFKITGRLKDMIIRGGENIYPKELEELIYTHPQVRDVQVVGVPNEKYGEVILAAIILIEDAILTEDEIRQFVAEHVARHKVPQYVEFVDSFPMNAAGKIQKFKMREQAIEKYNLQKVASIRTA